MKRCLLIAGLALLLAGCGPKVPPQADSGDIPAAQGAIRQTLAHPDSARFENVRQFQDRIICGEVASHNDDGQYIGYSPFFVNPATGAKGVLRNADGTVSDAVDSFPDECLPQDSKAQYVAEERKEASDSDMLPSAVLAADKGRAHGPVLYDSDEAPSDLLASNQPTHPRYGHRNPF